MTSTILKILLLAENDDSFCKTKVNGISWASGVELNYSKKR